MLQKTNVAITKNRLATKLILKLIVFLGNILFLQPKKKLLQQSVPLNTILIENLIKKMKNHFITAKLFPSLLFIMVLVNSNLFAQNDLTVIQADNFGLSPDNLAKQFLNQDGILVTNVTYVGDTSATGVFQNGSSFLDIDQGIILSTGLIQQNPLLPNERGIIDSAAALSNTDLKESPILGGLQAIAPTETLLDQSYYEINFISFGDSVVIDLVYASENYFEDPCFQVSNPNLEPDVLGVFLDGTNPNGTDYDLSTNLAKVNVPGKGDALINSFNFFDPIPLSCGTIPFAPELSDQYIDNDGKSEFIFDGHTKVQSIGARVNSCETYKLIVGIADIGDPFNDSGVFLRMRSVGNADNTAQISRRTRSNGTNPFLSESCQDTGFINFLYPAPTQTDLTYDLKIVSSTALAGADFEIFPSTITVPSGSNSFNVPIIPIQDELDDDGELLSIEIIPTNKDGILDITRCIPDTVQFIIRDSVLAIETLFSDTSVCLSNSLDITTAQTGSFTNNLSGSFSKTENAPIGVLNNEEPLVSVLNVSGLPFNRLEAGILTRVCIDSLSHFAREDLDIFLQAPSGDILELSTDNGGNTTTTTRQEFKRTCFTPSSTEIIHDGNPQFGEPYASDNILTGDFQPEGEWSDLWNTNGSPNGDWKLIINDDRPTVGNGDLGSWSLEFIPDHQVSFNWSPATQLSADNLTTVTYTPASLGDKEFIVTATDNFGCVVTDTVKVSVFEDQTTPIPTIQNDSTETSFRMNWTSASTDVTYQVRLDNGDWINVGNVETYLFEGLAKGTEYSVSLRIAEPCATLEETVLARTINCLNRVSTSAQSLSNCPSQNIGTLSLQNNSPIQYPPYTYRWSHDETLNAPEALNLTKGFYSVTITDNNGCTDQQTLQVQELELNGNPIITDASCFYEADGTVAINVQNGNGNYLYNFGDGFLPDNFKDGIAAGMHTFFVSDAAGCVLEVPLVVKSQLSEINLVPDYVEPNCKGEESGKIFVKFSPEENAPYTYQWYEYDQNTGNPISLTGQTTDTLNIAGIGKIYGVEVSDASGCVKPLADTFALISEPDSVFAAISPLKEISCTGNSDAILKATATGGNAPYQFTWQGGTIGDTIRNIPVGIANVMVTDANGCTNNSSYEVTEPIPLSINFPLGNSQTGCFFNPNELTLQTEITGGTMNPSGPLGDSYDYKWFSPQSELESVERDLVTMSNDTGWHVFQVTDLNECMAKDSILVTSFETMSFNVIETDNVCFGKQEGQVSINIFIAGVDETNNLTLQWDNINSNEFPQNETSASLSNLPNGNFKLTSTDFRNCTQDTIINITSPEKINLNPIIKAETCHLDNTGEISLNPTGGTGTYTYSWSVPNSGNTSGLTSLAIGRYNVEVTDGNSCLQIDSFLIKPGDNLIIDSTITHNSCFGDSTGEISLNVLGNKDQYFYEWENGDTSSTISELINDRYSVTISDKDNCTYIYEFEINSPSLIQVDKDTSNISCNGGEDGFINFFPEGGTPPYNYSLNDGPFLNQSSFIKLEADTFQITIRDSKGCLTDIDTTTLTEPDAILGDESTLDTLVDQFSDIKFEYPFAQVNNNFIVSWKDLTKPDSISPTFAYDTTILVDKNFDLLITALDLTTGCSESDVIQVSIIKNHELYVPTGFTPNGDLKNDILLVHGQKNIEILEFKVYNRWGNLMYEQSNFMSNQEVLGWDGTFKDKEMDSGVYIWTAEVKFPDNTTSFFKGKTTLFR